MGRAFVGHAQKAVLALAAAVLAAGAAQGVPALGGATRAACTGGAEAALPECAPVFAGQLGLSGQPLEGHGPDPLPLAALEAPCSTSGAGDQIAYLYSCRAEDPTCVEDPSEAHYGILVYVVPFNRPDDYAAQADRIRETLRRANGIVRDEAEPFGSRIDLRVLCSEGAVVVEHVVLPHATNERKIFQDLLAAGLTQPAVKYWIYYDDSCGCGLAGEATLVRDDRPVADNRNNDNTGYAIVYRGSLTPDVLLHEIGHTLGAVQRTAPHAIGAHCSDGQDIMCYDDRGLPFNGPQTVHGLVEYLTTPYVPIMCVDRTHFDCNHDDYFHPDPPAGNYLATHWNLGSSLNRFVAVSLIAPAPNG